MLLPTAVPPPSSRRQWRGEQRHGKTWRQKNHRHNEFQIFHSDRLNPISSPVRPELRQLWRPRPAQVLRRPAADERGQRRGERPEQTTAGGSCGSRGPVVIMTYCTFLPVFLTLEGGSRRHRVEKLYFFPQMAASTYVYGFGLKL